MAAHILRRIVVAAAAALVSGILMTACAERSHSPNDEHEIVSVLSEFIRAFENGDLERMETYFAEDALTFPRAIMSSDTESPIDSSEYRRVIGIDPQMKQLISRFSEAGAEPPYMELTPEDLEVQMFSNAAVVSFHLEDGASLSRRTFVLARREGQWRIVHLHASNVVGSN